MYLVKVKAGKWWAKNDLSDRPQYYFIEGSTILILEIISNGRTDWIINHKGQKLTMPGMGGILDSYMDIYPIGNKFSKLAQLFYL